MKARVKIDTPVFRDKTHVSIEQKQASLVASSSPAGRQTARRLQPGSTTREVWVDTDYRLKANETQLTKHGLRSKIQFLREPVLDLWP